MGINVHDSQLDGIDDYPAMLEQLAAAGITEISGVRFSADGEGGIRIIALTVDEIIETSVNARRPRGTELIEKINLMSGRIRNDARPG